jgi:hypothetical protein
VNIWRRLTGHKVLTPEEQRLGAFVDTLIGLTQSGDISWEVHIWSPDHTYSKVSYSARLQGVLIRVNESIGLITVSHQLTVNDVEVDSKQAQRLFKSVQAQRKAMLVQQEHGRLDAALNKIQGGKPSQNR